MSAFGFGPPGTRVLIGDVFLLLTVMCAFKKIKYGFSECVKAIGWLPLVVFLGGFAYSVIRGVAAYGGGALGDSRWFCAIVLLPVGYLIYDPKYLPTIKNMFITAATVHSVMVLVRYFTGGAWDISGEVMRFATGRASLIISIGCVCLLGKEFLSETRLKISLLQGGLLALFLLALVLGQTRTIFIMLPVAFVLIMWNLNALRRKTVVKVVIALVLLAVVGSIAFKTLLPADIQTSIYASFEVIGEVFNPRTYELIFEDDSALTAESIHARNEFSRSGNTYFRILAWKQVIATLKGDPGWFLVGLPIGTPFLWYGTGKKLFENLLPHNDYLAILARVGVIGFAGYIAILARFFIMTRRYVVRLKRLNDIPEGLVIVITMLMFLLLFVSINAELRAYASHFWVWLLLGMGIRIMSNNGKLPVNKRGLVRRILRQVCKEPTDATKGAV